MTANHRDLVLITGASGFVGSAVARIAQEKGYAVRVLVRPTSPRTNLAALDAEVVTGDMRDVASMRAALSGVRYLFHVAADYRLWAPDPHEIERANLEGAEATMRAALDAGVERIVYTSSVATLKVTSSGASTDETSPLKADQAIGVYKRSKVLSERAVERSLDVHGNEVEVVTTGRHDPCVGIRAVPICEAMLALVLMDQALRHRAQCGDVGEVSPRIPG